MPHDYNTTSDKDYNFPTHLFIPFFIYRDKSLDWFEKTLFSFLWSLASSGKKINASNNYLAELMQVSERHIQDVLMKLENLGYILRIRRGKRYIEVLHFEKSLIKNEDNCSDNELTRTTVRPSTEIKQTRTTVRDNTNHSSSLTRTTVHPDNKDNNKNINTTSTNDFFTEYKKQESENLERIANKLSEETREQSLKEKAIANPRCQKAFETLWSDTNATIEEAYDACQSYWETKGEIANWGRFIKFLGNAKSKEIFMSHSKTATKKAADPMDLIYKEHYQEFVGRLKSDINLNLKPKTTAIPTFEDWLEGKTNEQRKAN